MRERIHLFRERETQLEALDAAIAKGIDDAEAGKVKTSSQVFDRLEGKYAKLAKTR